MPIINKNNLHSEPILYQILLCFMLLSGCEKHERFYRPDLPEKLCCTGIIDIDGTTHYIAACPEFLDNRYSTRYVSFEKSFQSEYDRDLSDSLRDFSFEIISSEGTLFNFKSEKPVKNMVNFQLPDSLKFYAGIKYRLRAKEKDTPEISAETIAPELPPELKLLFIQKRGIPLSEPVPIDFKEVLSDSIKSVILKISFNNTGKKNYYALILVSKYKAFQIGYLFSGFLDFEVLESDSPGFLAPMHGIYTKYYRYSKDYKLIYTDGLGYEVKPVMAYFIESSKIPGNVCTITISTKFHGLYSSWFKWHNEIFLSLRLKLLSIPEELFLYEKALHTYNKVKNDPFSEPVYLNGNIKEGFGVFSICRSTELTVDFPTPY